MWWTQSGLGIASLRLHASTHTTATLHLNTSHLSLTLHISRRREVRLGYVL